MKFVDIHHDQWHTVGGEDGPVSHPPIKSYSLLTLAQWHAVREQWPAPGTHDHKPVGVIVSNDTDIETLEADLWRDIQPDFRTSHYLDGFAHADKKFHFKADWANPPFGNPGLGPWTEMPSLPDHWAIIEEADEQHPFRLATSP